MIKKLLSLIKQPSESKQQNTEQAILLAAIALLIEVAKADHELSHDEEAQLTKLVMEHFSSRSESHEELISLAQTSSNESTSLYEFTSIINDYYSQPEKFKLITCMWKIAFSDAVIDKYEEHLIRKVSDLIYLPHVKFIEAKHIAQNF